MNAALKYLRSLEFSMGNGQCPECGGVSEQWAGDFRHPRIDNTGHKRNCKLATAIKSVGGNVRYAKKVNRKESLAILERKEPGIVERFRESQSHFMDTLRKHLLDSINQRREA